MGRRGYPPEFRRKVLDLIAGGMSVAETAAVLGISDQTVYPHSINSAPRGAQLGREEN